MAEAEFDYGTIVPPPLHNYVGIQHVSQGDGRAVVTLPLGDPVRGLVAPLHGGAIATLADIASGASLVGLYDPHAAMPASTDLNIRFFRQPRSGPIRAEATVVHRGRTFIATECVVTDAEDRVVARTTGTYVLSNRYGVVADGQRRDA